MRDQRNDAIAFSAELRSSLGDARAVKILKNLVEQKPQNYEYRTMFADALVEILEPGGVIVIIDCEHLCMSMRGVRKSQARTTTSAVRGQLLNPTTRAEAISLINQSR